MGCVAAAAAVVDEPAEEKGTGWRDIAVAEFVEP